MPTFLPILDAALPARGPRQLYTHRFKQTMSPANLPELAKDVAAFADALGGSLIIGTNKEGVPLLFYPGVSPSHADTLIAALNRAHAPFLPPRPVAEPQILPLFHLDRSAHGPLAGARRVRRLAAPRSPDCRAPRRHGARREAVKRSPPASVQGKW